MLRIDRPLVEREFRAWTGSDETERIEFDQSQSLVLDRVGTLTRYVRMLCDDLGDASSNLGHPLIRDRVASAFASTLLVSIPHNRSCVLRATDTSVAPFAVRRVERFIEENARQDIGLEDLALVAGVSVRTLQTTFRRFRNTTPMTRLRALRLDLARSELARAGRRGDTVTSVANKLGFGHLGRFAADYRARFNESPSETLCRGSVGRSE
jgi:transcriptional regulator GlxA family with amidase domain